PRARARLGHSADRQSVGEAHGTAWLSALLCARRRHWRQRVPGAWPNRRRTCPRHPREFTPDVPSGAPDELKDLPTADQGRPARLEKYGKEMIGYAIIQSTRSQTLGYGLTDSAAGQLAWIVEKFKEWTDPSADLPEDAVHRDQLLTN